MALLEHLHGRVLVVVSQHDRHGRGREVGLLHHEGGGVGEVVLEEVNEVDIVAAAAASVTMAMSGADTRE